MSSKEFWEDDPKLYWAYRTFYLEKIEMEAKQKDYESWLTGLYFYNALNVTFSNMFEQDENKKKSYVERPMLQKEELNNKEKSDPKTTQQEEYQNKFNAWARY